MQVFVSTNGWDIDIVAAKKKYNELLLEYKDEIIRQINNKKVLRAHWKKKTIQESYNGECLKEVERLVRLVSGKKNSCVNHRIKDDIGKKLRWHWQSL